VNLLRVGFTNRTADEALIAEMRRYAHCECFDEQPLPDIDSEATEVRAASELFAPVVIFARSCWQRVTY